MNTNRSHRYPSVLASLVLAFFLVESAHGNLIQNPGFELGRNDWTFLGSVGLDTSDKAHTGLGSAYINISGGSVSQTVATIPGHVYQVDIYLAGNGSYNDGARLNVSFGNTVGFSQVYNYAGSPAGYKRPGEAMYSSDYIHFPFTATATTDSTTLTIYATMTGGTFFADDVSVVDTVPEPSTLCLLGLGWAGLRWASSGSKSSRPRPR